MTIALTRHEAGSEFEVLIERLFGGTDDRRVATWEQEPGLAPVWTTGDIAAVTGFTIDELATLSGSVRLHPADVEIVDDRLRRLDDMVAGRAPATLVTFDYRHRRDTGTDTDSNAGNNDDDRYRATAVLAWPLVRGGHTLIRGLAVDVTDDRRPLAQLQAANDELIKLNDGLADFTQSVTHDLRAPLRHLRSLVEFLREDLGSGLTPVVENRLAAIEQRVVTMDELIRDLLEYARSGALDAEPKTIDLQTLVTSTVDLVGGREGIEVDVQCDVGTIDVTTVPLSTCIRNLVDNAVKYHPGPDGTVVVRAARCDDGIEIVVSDDGAGIDPRYHKRIFEPFQSLNAGSSGLGLATLAKIADEHGATVVLDSAPGRGASFTIHWPTTEA